LLYATVHVLNVPYHADKSYTYHIPSQLEAKISVGSVVVVPFGGSNRLKNAIVTSISDSTDCKKTKPVSGVPGKYLYVRKELLELCSFMKEHLFCSFGDAVKCVLPSGLGVKAVKIYVPCKDAKTDDSLLNHAAVSIFSALQREGSLSETQLRDSFGPGAVSCARALEKMGLCCSEDGFECRINRKNERYASLTENERIIGEVTDGTIKLTAKQSAVFEVLLGYESPCPVTELEEASGAGISVINELYKKGVIELLSFDKDRNEELLKPYDKAQYGDFELSEMQQRALDTLSSMYETNKACAALLHGVTGSGKTNVILKLIDKVLDDGKRVIVLVPEIALTSQTVGRFAARYGERIALIHSGLSAGERMDAWRKITENKADIVIGTRSAVFAPVDNLGLIVLDEEQEGSFKSDRSPKYHARDIARFRCAYNDALLVLASATPSIDSFYKAQTGKYTYVPLTERYSGTMLPEVIFHDMRDEPYYTPESTEKTDGESKASILGGIPTTIGESLKKEITEVLKNKEQAILFINRRGFRAFAQCKKCGHTFECPNCSVTLTHHRNKRYGRDTMVCHYCGYTQTLPDKCPVCGKSESIIYMGAGTQLLEQQLYEMFPNIRVLRMDADTTSGKMSHEKILESFRKGEADILVGTQMVAKGHDFPNVSLVGVISADTSLYLNDFRANEKTFSLLTQVLGRAGRSTKRGKAVIQTYTPDNDVLRLSGLQDYKSFYDREILFRKASLFPPFCDIITVTFSGEVENDVVNVSKDFGTALDKMARNAYCDVKFVLFGPFRNEVYKIAGRYRMRYIIKCANNARFRSLMSELIGKYSSGLRDVSVGIDVNPINL